MLERSAIRDFARAKLKVNFSPSAELRKPRHKTPLMSDIDDEFNDDIDMPEQSINPEVGGPKASDGNDATAVPQGSGEPKELAQELPQLSRKDKTLQEVLEMMDGEFAPIIPDAVTDYYLAKNGFETSDVRIKRLLALATQKFVLDIAQDAYEYLRIRSSSSVYNSSNPQLRAKQLLQGQQFANQQLLTGAAAAGSVDGESAPQALQPSTSSAGNLQGKIVLTMEDLSSALTEYGLNTARPDFYH